MSVRTLTALAVAAALAGRAAACPFCSAQGQTLSGEVTQADFIVLGEVKNAKRDPSEFGKGTTELHVQSVVKPHPYLDGKKVLLLPRVIDAAAADNKYLVFCSLYSNNAEFSASAVASTAALANFSAYQLDPYRGEPVKADSKLPQYLKGALEVRQKDTITRLRYFFDYLDAADLVIGSDAYMEFGNADYKDVRELSKALPADRLLKWLKDPSTPASRYGLYGMMLGHCGRAEHAAALRGLLDDSTKLYSSGLDGLLAGYLMLDPKGGWEYLNALLRDPNKEFPVRYAGLKVLRFVWEFRPDLAKGDEVLAGMRQLASQADIADLPIEDLRKWERWDLTDDVLKLGKQESHAAVPIIKRAVLRFALSAAPKSKAAGEYVETARKEDPERVKLVEEMLRDEQPKAKPPAEARK
jgi:hypothetical protein